MYNGYTHKKLKDIWRKLFPSTKTWSQQFKLSEWHHRARRVSRWLKEMEETRKPKVFGDEFHLGEREESRLRPKRLAWEHRWTPCKQWAEKGLRGQSSEKKKKRPLLWLLTKPGLFFLKPRTRDKEVTSSSRSRMWVFLPSRQASWESQSAKVTVLFFCF